MNESIYYDKYNNTLTFVNDKGESTSTVIENTDKFIKEVRYEQSCLVLVTGDNQETRVWLGDVVDQRLTEYGIPPYQYNTGIAGQPSMIAQITQRVLVKFLQSPEGVRMLEEELNDYFKNDKNGNI